MRASREEARLYCADHQILERLSKAGLWYSIFSFLFFISVFGMALRFLINSGQQNRCRDERAQWSDELTTSTD